MNAIEPAAPRDVVVSEASAVVAEASAGEPARCKNCDAVLSGRFCVNCSQAANVHVPTTKELVHEMLEGITHSDSRLWRTLTTLWFKPGKLTEEFVAGRRVAYLPPFRLYLILSITFFLLASFVHPNVAMLTFNDVLKPGGAPASASKQTLKSINSCDDFVTWSNHSNWSPRIKHVCEAVLQDNAGNLVHLAIGTTSKAMFIFLPLIAFLNMLLYWRPRYRYAEQLLFFVHLHAFYFSVAILLLLINEGADSWPKLGGVAGFSTTILGWTLPVYTLKAMRRVFRRSWPGTLFKGVLLFFVYSVVFGLTVAGVFVYAAFQL
jgi:Protein of unknown function (DUF3667)